MSAFVIGVRSSGTAFRPCHSRSGRRSIALAGDTAAVIGRARPLRPSYFRDATGGAASTSSMTFTRQEGQIPCENRASVWSVM